MRFVHGVSGESDTSDPEALLSEQMLSRDGQFGGRKKVV